MFGNKTVTRKRNESGPGIGEETLEVAVNVLVAQLGARMHYAVPRILHDAGALSCLYTDFCVPSRFRRFLDLLPRFLQPAVVQRGLSRIPEGIPPEAIVSFNSLGLSYARRLRASRSASDSTRAFLWAGSEFCRRILQRGLGDAEAVYAFNTAALELFERGKAEGRYAIYEQTIAPKRVERELLEKERDRFPTWEVEEGDDLFADELIGREEAEWQHADRVICGSSFVRDSVIQCGGIPQNCIVVPYGVQPFAPRPRERCPGRLRVLVVGSVCLRKGSPYVYQAAKALGGNVEVRMVGSLLVSRGALESLREQVDVLGPQPRTRMMQHFHWADVFLLPSICEGSATVTYEALSAGLPVLTTVHAGSVVRDGVDGFLLPVGEVSPIVARLEELAGSPDLLSWMSCNARQRGTEFTVQKYGQRLLRALGSLGG